MNLPPAYAWLAKEPGPKMLLEGLALYGTHEGVGAADNPVILGWAREVGVDGVYKHDDIAWCGLFMALVAKRAGKPMVASPLWALNWGHFGQAATPAPMLGDVLTFVRPGGGHVGLYVGEDDACYHVLGGNTRDQVDIARIERARLQTARRPIWQIAQPSNVRRIRLAPTGAISTNES